MAIDVPFVPLTISCLLILTRLGLVGRGVSDPQIIMCLHNLNTAVLYLYANNRHARVELSR